MPFGIAHERRFENDIQTVITRAMAPKRMQRFVSGNQFRSLTGGTPGQGSQQGLLLLGPEAAYDDVGPLFSYRKLPRLPGTWQSISDKQG
jgi:hypothetical protein